MKNIHDEINGFAGWDVIGDVMLDHLPNMLPELVVVVSKSDSVLETN
jgi:hypothetical protein